MEVPGEVQDQGAHLLALDGGADIARVGEHPRAIEVLQRAGPIPRGAVGLCEADLETVRLRIGEVLAHRADLLEHLEGSAELAPAHEQLAARQHRGARQHRVVATQLQGALDVLARLVEGVHGAHHARDQDTRLHTAADVGGGVDSGHHARHDVAQGRRRAHAVHGGLELARPLEQLLRSATLQVREVERAQQIVHRSLELAHLATSHAGGREEGGGAVAVPGLVQVDGHPIGLVLVAPGQHRFVRVRRRSVQLATRIGRDRLEHRFAEHRRRHHDGRRSRTSHQSASLELRQTPIQLLQAHAQHRGERGGVHRVTQDGAGAQGRLVLRIEPRHARGQQRPQRAGNGDLARELQRRDLAFAHHQGVGLEQLLDQFLDEQRMAAGSVAAEGHQLLRGLRQARAQPDQPLGLLRSQLADVDELVVRERRERQGGAVAGAEHEHRAIALQPLCRRRDDVDRFGVEGVRVVPREDVQAILAQALHHARDRGAQRRHARARLTGTHRAELTHHRAALLVGQAQGAQTRLDALHALDGVALADAAQDLQHGGEAGEGHLASSGRARRHVDSDVVLTALQTPLHLVEEARLADPLLAANRHEPELLARRGGKNLAHATQFVLSSYETSERVVRRPQIADEHPARDEPRGVGQRVHREHRVHLTRRRLRHRTPPFGRSRQLLRLAHQRSEPRIACRLARGVEQHPPHVHPGARYQRRRTELTQQHQCAPHRCLRVPTVAVAQPEHAHHLQRLLVEQPRTVAREGVLHTGPMLRGEPSLAAEHEH